MIQTSPLQEYRETLDRDVREIYEIASRARKKGFDVTKIVEIPLASDMADRIEELIQIKGIADDIRKISRVKSREEVSIEIARKTAEILKPQGKKVALDKAVRVGLAILTEGILVAPLEGIADVSIGRNQDGTEFAAIIYSGPIRGAGGTAQALSVLIADIVRRDLGIGKFTATDDEVDRYVEEVEAYNRIKHLQYLPTAEEVGMVIRNSPIFIDGEGSEEVEISGHRNMKRISTNRIRGGMCLVLCEGLIQKSRKILKHTKTLNLNEWNFLDSLQSKDSGKKDEGNKSEKFLKDIIAGRPVFSHPGRPGGFRLRYGRSRDSGLAAASISPVSMVALDEFIAVGSQMKVELPGKAVAVTPCDTIEGPMVLLDDGSHLRLRTEEEARSVKERVVRITDVGEILISYGDFLENNHKLEKPAFTKEWWDLLAKGIPEISSMSGSVPEESEALELSRKHGIPLHPEYNYFWHDISMDEVLRLRNALMNADLSDGYLTMRKDEEIQDIMVRLGVEFSARDDYIIPGRWYSLSYCLGLEPGSGKLSSSSESEGHGDVFEYIRSVSGITVKPRSPTRIGARMGRPEKAGDRKMKPKVHVLFPIENFGDTRRSVGNARSKAGESLNIEAAVRICTSCSNETVQPVCESCGGSTEDAGRTERISVAFSDILERAEQRSGIAIGDLKGEFKAVKKLMSSRKVCEPIEKGLFRAYHDISTNKDGTCRFDMSDIPITHFRAEEIGVSAERLAELGYTAETNEIFPQDIIIPRSAAEFILRVSQYVDDLLVRYYGQEPFYNCTTIDDLVGKLVIGLAPHTSGGIVGRIIGFTDVSGCYAHPLFHAAKRRNCDGDEDSIMLLLDGLLNFSRDYLPSTRGGLMDAPLVITSMLNPDEVDKEAMNVDTLPYYPLEFYEAAENEVLPSEIEDFMRPMKKYIDESGTVMGISFTHDLGNMNDGVAVSSYKTILSMQEKIERQLGLAKLIRAVDENDVATRVLNSHFLPDIYGNFRKFFSQEFRCTKCNTKYRRIPLSGKCLKCGNEKLNLTIHRGSIVKYLEETVLISRNYALPDYLQARIENLVRMISETFPQEEEKNLSSYGA